MGFKLPKIKVSAPKITLDPVKSISSAVQGITDINQAVFIDPTVQLATAGVQGVGQVMAQPGAGAILSAGGAALGIPPGLTTLASGFIGSAPKGAVPNDPLPDPTVQYMQAPSSGNNNQLLMIGGAGFLGLILVLVMMKKR